MMRHSFLKIGLNFLMLVLTTQAQAQALDGDWTGKLTIGQQQLSLVFHIDTAKQLVKIDVPEQGAKALPTTITHLSADSINVQIPMIGFLFHGRLINDVLRGSFNQHGFRQVVVCTRGQKDYPRPQTPQLPLPYATEEVTFQNVKAGVTLSGTLSLPKDFKAGHTPVVLFITGSGAQNRDEECFSHKPFLVLADALARSGIASLRYDDRGIGKSTGDFKTATTFDFADDAEAGLQFLRSQKRFGKVGIIGHSEGGMIGFMLGSQQKADFIVSLAGPATRIDTLMCLQLNKLNQAAGIKAPLINSAKQACETLLRMSPHPWMRTFVAIDMTPYIRKVTCPMFHANGSLDLNVPAELTLPALRSNQPPNNHSRIKEYPGLNHMFQHATTGHPSECINIEETFSDEVINDILHWLKQL